VPVKSLFLCGLALALAAIVSFALENRMETRAAGPETLLAHDVYFTLKDSSPTARTKAVDACKKYLSGHPGTVFFAVGTREQSLSREVNDQDFDVALHIYFKDRAAHDKYQDSPRHKQFIAENPDAWKKVRVFDSTVEKQ
jgi:quinol monooxygenase YgiN